MKPYSNLKVCLCVWLKIILYWFGQWLDAGKGGKQLTEQNMTEFIEIFMSRQILLLKDHCNRCLRKNSTIQFHIVLNTRPLCSIRMREWDGITDHYHFMCWINLRNYQSTFTFSIIARYWYYAISWYPSSISSYFIIHVLVTRSAKRNLNIYQAMLISKSSNESADIDTETLSVKYLACHKVVSIFNVLCQRFPKHCPINDIPQVFKNISWWRKHPRYWPFVGEFTGHRWIPLTKASDAELWCSLWSAPDPTIEQTMETPVIWDAIAPIMTSLYCHDRHSCQLASNFIDLFCNNVAVPYCLLYAVTFGTYCLKRKRLDWWCILMRITYHEHGSFFNMIMIRKRIVKVINKRINHKMPLSFA